MHRPPTRGHIASGITIAALTLIASIQLATLSHWWWALTGATLTTVLTRDTTSDIRDRRDHTRALADLDTETP